MSGIGIITNPHSKLNKRNPNIIRQLELASAGRATLVKTENLKDLSRKIESFSKNGIHTIAICGGDGTISRTLNAVSKFYEAGNLPKIVVLKGGTMNLVASELGISGKPVSILKRFLDLPSEKVTTKEISSLRVNQHLGFIYADGTNLAILEKFYLNKSGVFGAFLLGIKIVISYLIKSPLFDELVNETDFTVVGDSKAPKRSLGNFAGTIGKLPLGLPLLPLIANNPDRFQGTFVTCPKKKTSMVPASYYAKTQRRSFSWKVLRLSSGIDHSIFSKDSFYP